MRHSQRVKDFIPRVHGPLPSIDFGQLDCGKISVGADMRRRELIGLFGLYAAWPLTARSQTAMPVVGFLHLTSLEATRPLVTEFLRGLGEQGYIENKNVRIEFRWGEGRFDRIPAMIEELVDRRVSVIVPMGNTNILMAAKAATSEIPIVFMTGLDPVKAGIVDSLRAPGGNITGINLLAVDLGAKRLEFLMQMVPTANTVAYLRNPGNAISQSEGDMIQSAARTLGVQLAFADAGDQQSIEDAFANVIRNQDMLLVSADSFLNFQSEKLVELAARYSVPTSYNVPYAVELGGLMSYSTDFPEAWRQAGALTGHILRGDKPSRRSGNQRRYFFI